jgi:hypothetical protein
MSPVLRHRLCVAGVLIAFAASGYAGFRLWQWQQPPQIVSGAVAHDCDLNRAPCEASFPGGGRLRISVSPRPIPLITPVTVEVQLFGLHAEAVQIDLNSPDMNMGYNRHQLARKSGERFVGHTLLPVCIRDRMTWQLQATARTAEGPLGAIFQFETVVAKGQRG